MEISVFWTPAMLWSGGLSGAHAVVIDALRMTSVAITAIANGCRGLCAAAEVGEAREIAARHGALLGGERNALPIEGFDFGNSPAAYSEAMVNGRRVVMCTTNGTKAILAAGAASHLLLGGFVNAGAVARVLAGAEKVAIICAGTNGAFTLEDALAAGAILARLEGMSVPLAPDDAARAAMMLYSAAGGDLHAALRQTLHYRRLLSLGLAADLQDCLTEDIHTAVPARQADGWFA